MISILLDECGHFELGKNAFIAGAVYIGKDYEQEKQRLQTYLKEQCMQAGGFYPSSLHRKNNNDNENIVMKVKRNVSSSLKEYLCNSGNYHIFAMLKSKNGRCDLCEKSNLLNDELVSNRYEHMACNVINNLIFDNVVLDDNTVNLDIATRITVIPLEEKERIKTFEKLGYKKNENNIGKITYYKKPSVAFYATDEKTYRTSLSSLMMYRNKRKVKFENINIKSIDYEEDAKSMEFLYLADFICDSLNNSQEIVKYRKGINEDNLNREKVQSVYNWAKDVTGGNEPLIWVYDNIDGIYNSVMNYYNNEQIFEALGEIFEGIFGDSEFKEFYSEVWFKKIISKISNYCVEIGYKGNELLGIAINKLDYYVHSAELKQEKGVFIFEHLLRFVKTLDGSKYELTNSDKYKLLDIGIDVYNHKGDIKKTEELFQGCKELKESVDIETYLNTLNKRAVIYADKFQFREAANICSDNIECYKILKEAKKEISKLNDLEGERSYNLTNLGISLSSYGQYCSFVHDMNAKEYFEEALKEFEDDSYNYNVTLSYFLHFAIEIENKDLYEKCSLKYLGGNENLISQFEFIINNKNSDINKNFQLYVYIKALNVFYSEKINDDLLYKLNNTKFEEDSYGFYVNGHPWELIYKNIGIILYKNNYSKNADLFMEKACTTINTPDTTIVAINYLTSMTKYYLKNDNKNLEKAVNEFKTWCKNESLNDYFSDCFKEKEIFSMYKKINSKFTYMYT